MPRVEVAVGESADGWSATVTVHAATPTTHQVRVTADERARYGGGDVEDLVRRSFAFLLEQEPNTSILREFSLSAIERYFPEYPRAVRRR